MAAQLSRLDTGSVVFSYTPDWIADGGDAVASTLPVTTEGVVTAVAPCRPSLPVSFPKADD